MMHHRFALRRRVPGVVHWMKANQTNRAKSKNGMRRQKRNYPFVVSSDVRILVRSKAWTYQPPREQ